MAELSIGEVESLTGVKAHILRYWEEHIFYLKPRKDIGGRRIYSTKDIQIIMRLKHLIQQKKYTIEGAQKQLFDELTTSREISIQESLDEVRSDLINLYTIIDRRRKYNEQKFQTEKE